MYGSKSHEVWVRSHVIWTDVGEISVRTGSKCVRSNNLAWDHARCIPKPCRDSEGKRDIFFHF